MSPSSGRRGTVEAGASKGHREALVALRGELARAIDATTSARDIATLSGQLADVLGKIAALDKVKPAPTGISDELAARRRRRRLPADPA